MLNRLAVIQQLITATDAQSYLEIGVSKGGCFLNIKAPFKMAVDPLFRIPALRKLKYLAKNLSNFNNHYFEKTSDDFFASHKQPLSRRKPKVVFVDGLHTYEQSLRDVLNSLLFLEGGGVIVVHDCNPLKEAAGLPAKSIHEAIQKTAACATVWNGDVWKTVVHLRSRSDLEVLVLDCDHGLCLIRKGTPKNPIYLTQAEIERLSYADLERSRKELLNLQPPDYFNTFVSELA